MKREELGEYQEKVFLEAKIFIQNEPWYRGVCLDAMPSEEYCKNHSSQAIANLIAETFYWDSKF